MVYIQASQDGKKWERKFSGKIWSRIFILRYTYLCSLAAAYRAVVISRYFYRIVRTTADHRFD
jgi:hypothetical protein